MDDSIRKSEFLALFSAVLLLELSLARFFPEALLVDMPLIFTAYVGLRSSAVRGAAAGTVFGLLQDVILGLPLGINGFSKTLFGFLAGYLNKRIMVEGFLTRTLLLAGLSLLDNTVVYSLLSMSEKSPRPGFQTDFVLELTFTAITGGVILGLYDRIRFPRKDFREFDSRS